MDEKWFFDDSDRMALVTQRQHECLIGDIVKKELEDLRRMKLLEEMYMGGTISHIYKTSTRLSRVLTDIVIDQIEDGELGALVRDKKGVVKAFRKVRVFSPMPGQQRKKSVIIEIEYDALYCEEEER